MCVILCYVFWSVSAQYTSSILSQNVVSMGLIDDRRVRVIERAECRRGQWFSKQSIQIFGFSHQMPWFKEYFLNAFEDFFITTRTRRIWPIKWLCNVKISNNVMLVLWCFSFTSDFIPSMHSCFHSFGSFLNDLWLRHSSIVKRPAVRTDIAYLSKLFGFK